MKLPEERPPIRKGQYWKKTDSGEIMLITGSRSGSKYMGRKIGVANGQMRAFSHSHGVNKKDLWLFWKRI